MPIFLAELRRTSNATETVNINVEFEIIIDSDALGVNNQTLAKVETIEPLPITAPVRLSNMDLNLSTDQIFDDSGQQVTARCREHNGVKRLPSTPAMAKHCVPKLP